jgi:hypothetical protein
VTFTATVTGLSGTPTGLVAFKDGANVITNCGTQPLTGGIATCTRNDLAVGTHSITAQYSGDATYGAFPSAATIQTVSPVVAPTKKRFDFNNDGKSDIFFRNGAGINYVWQLNGLAIVSQGQLPGVDTTWAVAGIGDFNGDGNADILWRQASTGANYVWHLSGAFTGGVMTIISQGLLPSADSSWSVAGIGDFNGDGKSDILWRKTDGTVYIWHVNGAVISGGLLQISSQGLLPSVDSTWSVAGIADFNGDGKSDIFWRNVDGTNFIWHIDGTTFTGGLLTIASQGLLPSVDNTWSVAGVGDYNGDGKGDVFWRKSDGTNYVWHVNGAVIAGGLLQIVTQGLLPSVDTTWSVAGYGDYNGDGKSDVYWRQPTSSTNYIWFVDGTVISGGLLSIPSQGLLPTVDSTWSIPNPK